MLSVYATVGSSILRCGSCVHEKRGLDLLFSTSFSNRIGKKGTGILLPQRYPSDSIFYQKTVGLISRNDVTKFHREKCSG